MNLLTVAQREVVLREVSQQAVQSMLECDQESEEYPLFTVAVWSLLSEPAHNVLESLVNNGPLYVGALSNAGIQQLFELGLITECCVNGLLDYLVANTKGWDVYKAYNDLLKVHPAPAPAPAPAPGPPPRPPLAPNPPNPPSEPITESKMSSCHPFDDANLESQMQPIHPFDRE